ncbi:hypothetical protein E4413_18745 [Leptospira interrogans]|nr:hypothetical protein E4413_18745 [Leptospira interrogans]
MVALQVVLNSAKRFLKLDASLPECLYLESFPGGFDRCNIRITFALITELMLIYGFYSKNPIHFKQFFFVLNIKKPGKQNRADFMSFDSLTESFNLKNLYQIQ